MSSIGHPQNEMRPCGRENPYFGAIRCRFYLMPEAATHGAHHSNETSKGGWVLSEPLARMMGEVGHFPIGYIRPQLYMPHDIKRIFPPITFLIHYIPKEVKH